MQHIDEWYGVIVWKFILTPIAFPRLLVRQQNGVVVRRFVLIFGLRVAVWTCAAE